MVKRYKKVDNKKILMTDSEVRLYKAESSRRTRKKLRTETLFTYGGKCACCGETKEEFLAIDHVFENGAKERRELEIKASGEFYLFLKRAGFPSGYRVLCHNCNSSLAYYGYCPHGNVKSFKQIIKEVVEKQKSTSVLE